MPTRADIVIAKAEGCDVVVEGVTDDQMRDSVRQAVVAGTREARRTAARLRTARPGNAG